MGKSNELFMEIRQKEIDEVDDSEAEIYKQLHEFYQNFGPQISQVELEDLFKIINKDE